MTDRTNKFIQAWNSRVKSLPLAERNMAQIDVYPIPKGFYIFDDQNKVMTEGGTELCSHFFTAWINADPSEPSYFEISEKLCKVMEEWLITILIQMKHESSKLPDAAKLLNNNPIKL